MKSILAAKRQYLAFLSQCEQFQLLHPVIAFTYQRINSEEHIDPSLVRGEKIEQKRQEMVLGQKIRNMQVTADSARHTTCVILSVIQAVILHRYAQGPCSMLGVNAAGDDEEVQRDLWIAKVKHSTIKSVQAIGMLLQELSMLEMRAQQESRQQRCRSDDPTAAGALPCGICLQLATHDMRTFLCHNCCQLPNRF